MRGLESESKGLSILFQVDYKRITLFLIKYRLGGSQDLWLGLLEISYVAL